MNASIEDRIRSNRVFILGAGFSAAAGIPLTHDLINEALDDMRIESRGIYRRIDDYYRECKGNSNLDSKFSGVDLSKLCTYLEFVELREYAGGERFSADGSREKTALRFFLAKILARHTPSGNEIPRIYIDFVRQLHKGDIVISFNWDGLLEVTMNHMSKPYTYNFAGDDAIWLCKLHGSINWRRNKSPFAQDRLVWYPLGFDDALSDAEIYHTVSLLNYDTWQSQRPFGEVIPFLVLPGYGKAHDVRSVAKLWYNPEFAFAATHNIYIIGLSLSDDDFFIKSYFLFTLPYIESFTKINGRTIYIINPDSDSERNYDFIISRSNCKWIQERFSVEHLALM